MTIEEFLLARIEEDYWAERGDAGESTAVEFAARIRANIRALSFGTVSVRDGHLVPYAQAESARYAGHPDYRPEWAA